MGDQTRPRQRYMGTAEVAAHFGVTVQAVCNWRARGKLPEPLVVLAMGPIWATRTILAWTPSPRKPGRPGGRAERTPPGEESPI